MSLASERSARLKRVRAQASAAACLVRMSYKQTLDALVEDRVREEHEKWCASRAAELDVLRQQHEDSLISIGTGHKLAAQAVVTAAQEAEIQTEAWREVAATAFQRYRTAATSELRQAELAVHNNPVLRYDESRRHYLSATRVSAPTRVFSDEAASPARLPVATDTPAPPQKTFSAIEAARDAAEEAKARTEQARRRAASERAIAVSRGRAAVASSKKRVEANAVLEELQRLQSRDR
jgi:hypothetical protein